MELFHLGSEGLVHFCNKREPMWNQNPPRFFDRKPSRIVDIIISEFQSGRLLIQFLQERMDSLSETFFRRKK